MRPLIVVEASARAAAEARREVDAAGWRVVDGWRNQASVVCAGVVADAGDAAEALLAALAGAGLVLEIRADRELVDRLVDDLRRLGPVEHRTREPEPSLLTREERDLLELLAQGITVGEASKRLHLSRRTADRRLAAARQKLGVVTTAEAVVTAARL